eukprot:2770907-Amphidinium_carterae.1
MPKARVILKERAVAQVVEGCHPPPPPKPDEWDPYVNTWLESEDALGGVFKVSAPMVATLAEFARVTIAPLSSLLCAKVCLISRRGLDPQVRVSYVRDTETRLPIVTPSIEEFTDLRAECEIASRFCPMSYLQFTLAAHQIEYILNYWTHKGRECGIARPA